MKNASLKVGQHLTLNNEKFEILRIQDGMYHLENRKDFSLRSKSKEELLRALESGELKFTESGNNLGRPDPVKRESRNLSSYPQDQQEIAKQRLDYIGTAVSHFGERPCYYGLERIISLVSSKLRDPSPPSPNTLYRWWRLWEKSGRNITSLIPKPKSGYVTRKFSTRVLSMLRDIVYDDYLKRESFSKQDAYDRLKYLVNNHNKKTNANAEHALQGVSL
ncbi:MAG: hypothetical protein NVV73_17390 [Cellvibrionaceae bacterium]|nr:hypothetical protein [Cellvibrionaceae bacterium]